jgi:hypothetical protein
MTDQTFLDFLRTIWDGSNRPTMDAPQGLLDHRPTTGFVAPTRGMANRPVKTAEGPPVKPVKPFKPVKPDMPIQSKRPSRVQE